MAQVACVGTPLSCLQHAPFPSQSAHPCHAMSPNPQIDQLWQATTTHRMHFCTSTGVAQTCTAQTCTLPQHSIYDTIKYAVLPEHTLWQWSPNIRLICNCTKIVVRTEAMAVTSTISVLLGKRDSIWCMALVARGSGTSLANPRGTVA